MMSVNLRKTEKMTWFTVKFTEEEYVTDRQTDHLSSLFKQQTASCDREQEVPGCLYDLQCLTHSAEYSKAQERTALILFNMDICFLLIVIMGTGTFIIELLMKQWSLEIIKKTMFFKKVVIYCLRCVLCLKCVWFIFCFLFTGLVSGDSIEPDKEKNVITKETETVKLSCSYSASSNYIRLFWYRQYPNGELMFLTFRGARSWRNTDTADARFQSITSDTSTELSITEVHLSDSALYYCALLVWAQWYKT